MRGRHIIVIVLRFPLPGTEERTKSRDLVNGNRFLSVYGFSSLKPMWRFGGRRAVVVVVALFCSQKEEPLIQAQGADPNNYLFWVEIAAWFFLSVCISIHVNYGWLTLEKVKRRRRRINARKMKRKPNVMWSNLKRWKLFLRIYMVGKGNRMEDHEHGPTSTRCMSLNNVT